MRKNSADGPKQTLTDLRNLFKPLAAKELNDFASRYAAAWSGRDPINFAAFYAENGSLRINHGEPAEGRDAVAQMAQGFMTAFPDMVVRLVDLRGHERWTIDEDGLILESLGHLDDDEYRRQLNADSESIEAEM